MYSKNLFWLVLSLSLLYGGDVGFSQTDFWMQANGPYGDNINAFAINSDGEIFAGTDGGGLFRSSDNGDDWTPTGLTDIRVFALVINDSGHIFAGTGEVGFPYMRGDVFRSTDNGATWTLVGLAHARVEALAINASGASSPTRFKMASSDPFLCDKCKRRHFCRHDWRRRVPFHRQR